MTYVKADYTVLFKEKSSWQTVTLVQKTGNLLTGFL